MSVSYTVDIIGY